MPPAPHPPSISSGQAKPLPKGTRAQNRKAPALLTTDSTSDASSSLSLSRPAGEASPALSLSKGGEGAATLLPDALAPTWLLREPLPLDVQGDDQPCHHGPLRLLTGPRRIEAGWWPDDDAPAAPAAARDYYIAQNPAAELLWIYRERATSAQQGASNQPRWFLQGLYA